nr:hypothetical protein [Tanacetum cinerariifolium]
MALEEDLVATTKRLEIGKGNQRLSPDLKSNEATIQVVLDALKLTWGYNAFFITVSVLEIYMQEFWATVTLHHTLLPFKLNSKSHTLNMENFKEMLNICPRLPRERFQDPLVEEEILSFLSDLDHSGEIRSISKRNKMFWYTTRDDLMFNTIRVILRYQDTQIYGDILLDVLTSQDMLEFKAYKEYYAFPTRAVPPKAKTTYKKKAKEPVTSKTASESVSKGFRLKTQAKMKKTRKKTNVKGLTMLTKAALSEAGQLKLATKRSKKDFHISHASGSGDGVGRLSKSWGDSKEEGGDDDDGNNDDEGGNDDEGNDDAKSDDEQTESENNDDESIDNEDDEEVKELYDDVNINLGNIDAEMTDADQGTTKQHIYQEEEEAHVTLTQVHDATKADEPLQSSSVSFNFISKFLNLKNPAPTNTEIALLMKTFASQDTIPPTTPTLFTHVTQQQQQQQTPTLPTTTSITIPELLDFASLFKFDQRVQRSRPSAGSDQGMKRRRTSKDAYSSKDPRSKKKRSTSSSKEAFKSRHTSSSKSVHLEEPIYNVEDTSKHQDQEYVIGETDEQPNDKKATKFDWFKKPKRPPTPDFDWSKRRQIDFQPPQTWISQAARTEGPPSSFDEFNATMSLTELEYHPEECSKATAEKLDWNNPENKPYP